MSEDQQKDKTSLIPSEKPGLTVRSSSLVRRGLASLYVKNSDDLLISKEAGLENASNSVLDETQSKNFTVEELPQIANNELSRETMPKPTNSLQLLTQLMGESMTTRKPDPQREAQRLRRGRKMKLEALERRQQQE